MTIKKITNNSIAMFFVKALSPGGIRTRAFCSRGECDVECPTPPGQIYVYLTKVKILGRIVETKL
jgi:hypothetical protein